MEKYSETVNRCYLSNYSDIDYAKIVKLIDWLNENKLICGEKPGIIETNYAPKDDDNIELNERVFYTNQNAKIIDNIRTLIRANIEEKSPELLPFVLAPLLVKSSIHANTSGVFKGFHKKNDIGHFGGAAENALKRIMGEITLDYPVFSDVCCEVDIFRDDTNQVVKNIDSIDIAYYDPPYNQHPYGSNYFMLNIINDYNDKINIQDGVSGISKDWNRSLYNKRQEASVALNDLLDSTKSKYIVISYNNEGIIPVDIFQSTLEKYGDVTVKEKEYNTYRGSRNLKNRDDKVKELLWVLKKK